MSSEIILAMTGASGSPYFLRLLESCIQAGVTVHLLISQAGLLVLNQESSLTVPAHPIKQTEYFSAQFNALPNQVIAYGEKQWTAAIASGGHTIPSMIICPCTTGTLSSIAHGLSDNLLERAADVMIKERRQLILAVREMPLSVIHLRNMTMLAEQGVVIMPPNPGFYHAPQKIEDLVDFVVARILDHVDIAHQLSARWGMS